MRDVVAFDSQISFVDGEKGQLLYRGYNVVELAEKSSFGEVAYLLWYGRLPGKVEFDAFLDGFTGSMELPTETVMILRMFPRAATPMEVLRTAVSSMGHWDPDSGNTRLDASMRKAQRITERIPLIIASHQRLRDGLEPVAPLAGESIAYNLLYCLHGERPDVEMVKVLDAALILHADHELPASTFAARVTAATMSDIYSSVTSAIGALKGRLHGGANEQVMLMLNKIGEPAKAEPYVLEALGRKERIPGFGHAVYRIEDPRAAVLRDHAQRLSKRSGKTKLLEIASEVERVMLANSKVFPNVDFYSGIIYDLIGIPVELFTPLFACSRVVGWTAHILEQWSNNKLIRPRANYTGPFDLQYVSIDERRK
ncbi:MAG: citrate synthase [Armatimonadetes bacterium]|nr:citrate synthase [Armatimonadota bacterium]NIM23510.1 citrate synthase [Armatimonadota bacterium]NIM67376.1 citrate synthase [Armatimonadota bacterium]NIM75877.1 citrate synthase [Armatimonadota bacterium]NIN05562.1 citrate synthase [Armatimonadota bacterium]